MLYGYTQKHDCDRIVDGILIKHKTPQLFRLWWGIDFQFRFWQYANFGGFGFPFQPHSFLAQPEKNSSGYQPDGIGIEYLMNWVLNIQSDTESLGTCSSSSSTSLYGGTGYINNVKITFSPLAKRPLPPGTRVSNSPGHKLD